MWMTFCVRESTTGMKSYILRIIVSYMFREGELRERLAIGCAYRFSCRPYRANKRAC